MHFNTFVALVLFVVAASATAARPSKNAVPDNRDTVGTTCYTNAGASGSYKDYFDYAPSLGSYDNSFKSCCMYGIWMWYDLQDYNMVDFNQAMYYYWDEYGCVDFPSQFYDSASSLRYAGYSDTFKEDMINFYEGHYYMGDEHFYYNDAPSFGAYDNVGDSIIVTGCSPWTVYEYDNYQGSSVCFYPLSEFDCTPGFYDTPAVMAGISRKMSSTARGCFAEKKLYPKPVPKGLLQKFQPNH